MPLSAEGENCDASMWLRPVAAAHHRVWVLRPFDCTDLATGRDEAHVLAKSFRRGVTREAGCGS